MSDNVLMKDRVLLRKLEITGVIPHLGDREGTVNYKATFEITQGTDTHTMEFTTSTAEGFTVAATLACHQLAEYAKWLAAEAEKVKDGPVHIRL